MARRRVVKKKPPEGAISWGKPTFERLVNSEPEPLTSSFTVTHAMVLNVIDRPGNAYQAMKHLLRDNHEDRAKQRKHIHRAIEIYRALLAGGVVERLDEPDEKGRYVRLTVDLQYDFALNQPLSPFALAAIELLDRESETYALDVLSVIESTLDDPRQILSAQQFRARGEAVAAMKSEGIEYEERMELLDSVTWPKPLEDVLEAGYDIYRRGHPWVGDYHGLPQDRRQGHVRAGDDLRRVRAVLQPVPVRGHRAAVPGRRLQGAAGRPSPTRPRARSWPTSSNGWAS